MLGIAIMSGLRVEDGSLVISRWWAGVFATIFAGSVLGIIVWGLSARDAIPDLRRDIANLRAEVTTSLAWRDQRAANLTAQRNGEISEIRDDLRKADADQDDMRRNVVDRLARLEEGQKGVASAIEEIKRQISTASLRR